MVKPQWMVAMDKFPSSVSIITTKSGEVCFVLMFCREFANTTKTPLYKSNW